MSDQLDLFDQQIPAVIERLTFNQAVRLFKFLYWDRKKMAKKMDSLVRYMLIFVDGRLLDAIGRLDMENLRHYLKTEKKLGPSQLNKAQMFMRVMVNMYEEWKEDGSAGGYDLRYLKLPRRNPGTLIKRLPEPAGDRYITPWEFRSIYKIARRLGDYELADMIRLGIWARLSPIDLQELNDDEINEQDFQIEVYRRHTKTDQKPQGKFQLVPLVEKMWALINRRRSYRRPGNITIFSKTNLRRRVAKVRKLAIAAGMKDFTLRDLRRSGSGKLYEDGIPDDQRAEGMGNSVKVLRSNYTPKTRPHLRKQSRILVEAF